MTSSKNNINDDLLLNDNTKKKVDCLCLLKLYTCFHTH